MASKETTQSIALKLLNTFIAAVFILFATNIALSFICTENTSRQSAAIKEWFELLKSSMILLGSALTTVIGYYFGQRDGKAQADKQIGEIEQVAKGAFKERDIALNSTFTKESDSPNDTPPSLGGTSGIETP